MTIHGFKITIRGFKLTILGFRENRSLASATSAFKTTDSHRQTNDNDWLSRVSSFTNLGFLDLLFTWRMRISINLSFKVVA